MNTPQKVTDTSLTDNLYQKWGIHSPAKLEQLLLEVETLLRSAPPEPSNAHIQITPPDLQWIGEASAVMSQWNSVRLDLNTMKAEVVHLMPFTNSKKV